jgi:tRNA(Ile)-lysidine synthase
LRESTSEGRGRGRRSTPTRPALLRRLDAAVPALDLAGRAVAVACSGGVDSTALAVALVERARRHRLRVAIAHVNHSLRGTEADADEAAVRALADKLGVPFASARVDPRVARAQAASSRARPTVQEAARRLRERALRRLAGSLGSERIATAHTADDQAETLLLRLLRGVGPTGLAGIPPRSDDGVFVRPLLRASRDEVLAYAAARDLAWREDPSNADRHYARSRLRQDWLPGLRDAFNPRLLRALGDLAEAAREESDWIDALVAEEAGRRIRVEPGTTGEDPTLRIEADGWQPDRTPDALGRRLLREALHQLGAGRDVTRAHLDRALGFLREARPGARLELPASLRLVREARGFRLGRFSLRSGGPC